MDYIVRATAADGQIRAFAATTRETVETARQDHNTSPVATAALGRLLTAGAMMGVMMKGDKDLLTLRIHAGGPLIAVGRKELNEMIQEAKPVELKCHFCNSAYEFSTEDLKELLRKSK